MNMKDVYRIVFGNNWKGVDDVALRERLEGLLAAEKQLSTEHRKRSQCRDLLKELGLT